MANPQLGEIGVLTQLVNVDVLHISPQEVDRARQQVVRQRTRRGLIAHAPIYARGFKQADHNRKHPLAIYLFQKDDMRVAGFVDDDARELHLNRHVATTFSFEAEKERMKSHAHARKHSFRLWKRNARISIIEDQIGGVNATAESPDQRRSRLL